MRSSAGTDSSKILKCGSLGDSEIVDFSGGGTAGSGSYYGTAGHSGLLPGTHEEGVFSRFYGCVERDLIGPDSSVLSGESNLFVALDTGFAAGDTTEASYLKLPAIALFFEDDEGEVR